MRKRGGRNIRVVAGLAQRVSVVFARHARTTRRGVPHRCEGRSRGKPSGPIIFPTPANAQAAADELAELGQSYSPVPCVHGRHWHLRALTIKERTMLDGQRVDLDTPTWLVARDGDTVRAAVADRLGAEAAVADMLDDDEACDNPNCTPCSRRRKAREEKPSATA